MEDAPMFLQRGRKKTREEEQKRRLAHDANCCQGGSTKREDNKDQEGKSRTEDMGKNVKHHQKVVTHHSSFQENVYFSMGSVE